MTTPLPIHWTAPRAAYTPGETIARDVYDISGIWIGRIPFVIGRSPGSGFAGQVYQANAASSLLPEIVAIKALRPRSSLKTWFRDLLFFICYQSSYAPRLREEAVRTGLAWQAILRAAAAIEMGSALAVAQPLGYFWDPDLACFAEVQEWVEGRPAHNEPDERLLARLFGGEAPAINEMNQKKHFMDALHATCKKIGAVGLARQYQWWTLVSQANVLTRINVLPGQFCAVDCRPGLAVPFFLPFTPGHAGMILDGLRRGILVHFSEVNFDALDHYLQHHPELSYLSPMVIQLREDEAAASQGSLCLWHTRARFLIDPKFRRQIQTNSLQDLLRTNQACPRFAQSASANPGC